MGLRRARRRQLRFQGVGAVPGGGRVCHQPRGSFLGGLAGGPGIVQLPLGGLQLRRRVQPLRIRFLQFQQARTVVRPVPSRLLFRVVSDRKNNA